MPMLTILRDEYRFLTFRDLSPAVRDHYAAYLGCGLFFTWLAGVGRYWDNPRAQAWQSLGLGSLAYVVILALVLWGVLAPLRPRHWTYANVLLFVSLTAPPALLYAIPVERWFELATARAMNAWFLAIVAAWRVALLARYLVRVAKLGAGAATVGTLLPLVLIVVALATLNLEHVVFEIMSGLPPEQRSANDSAYRVVVQLALLAIIAAPFLIVGYSVAVYQAWRRPRAE
jgi:hypothetical protein